MSTSRITRGIEHGARRFREDLSADRRLAALLVVAVLLCGFWFFHLIPNFATQDEHARLLDVFPLLGVLVTAPSSEAIVVGVTQGRLYGATFYLNLLAMVPAVVVAVLSGQADIFAPFYRPEQPINTWAGDTDLWWLWHSTPEWVWSSSLLVLRLMAVVFAVSCVYFCYRIGTELRNRSTGLLAGTLLTLTFGFVVTAHEAGEDIPMVAFLLLTVYLSIRYSHTGDRRYFLAGCVSGGLAIGFKLTGVAAVIAIGTTYVLRAVRDGSSESTGRVALRPRLFVAGLAVGVTVVVLGFPSVLVSGPEALVDRLVRGTAEKGSAHGHRVAPSWWWIVRNYANAFGLALFGGVIASLFAIGPLLRQDDHSTDGLLVVLGTMAGCLLLVSWWSYVRVHHLLPTIPLLLIVLAAGLDELRNRTHWAGRVAIAVLVITSGLYTGVGTLGYVDQPRAQAADWLDDQAPANATVEVYEKDMQDSAVPHGMQTSHYGHRYPNGTPANADTTASQWRRNITQRCPRYVLLTWDDLRSIATPEETPNAARTGTPFARHIDGLVTTDDGLYSAYEPVRSFGPTPVWMTDDRTHQLPELVRVGVVPRTVQYGDEQDLGPEGYVLVLERTRPCSSANAPGSL